MIQTEHVTKFVGGSPQKVCTPGTVVGECFGFIEVSTAIFRHERMRKLSTRSIESIWASFSVPPWVVSFTKTENRNLKLKCPYPQSSSRVPGANYKHATTGIYIKPFSYHMLFYFGILTVGLPTCWITCHNSRKPSNLSVITCCFTLEV